MWILTANGFLSLRATSNPSELLVLARRRGHIEAWIHDARVQDHNPRGQSRPDGPDDHRYSAIVTREAVHRAIAREIDQLTPGSFRAAIGDPHYHDAINRARQDLHALQAGSPYAYLNRPEFQEQEAPAEPRCTTCGEPVDTSTGYYVVRQKRHYHAGCVE